MVDFGPPAVDKIDKYEIVGVIGEGGMGRVYEARDPIIGRRVAIKMISIDRVRDGEVHARFVREAQAAGQLSHPNLITIHDIGVADTEPYIVMELLDGEDLGTVIKQGRLTLAEKLRIMREMCEGLAFAHKRGVVHRDIKPGNIFITSEGRVKIVDFGLARSTVSDITQTGHVVGTPNYMAPEQIRGETIDQRADIFSAGVVFYELLSGRKAFEGDTVATTIYKVLETQPPAIDTVNAAIPVELSGIIDRAIAKDPQARYQTVGELLADLSKVAAKMTTVAVPIARVGRWIGWRSAAGALVVVAVVALYAISIARPSPSAADSSSPQASPVSNVAADRSLVPDRVDTPPATPPAPAAAPAVAPPAPTPRQSVPPSGREAAGRQTAPNSGRSVPETPRIVPPPIVTTPPPSPVASTSAPSPVTSAPLTPPPIVVEPRNAPVNVPPPPPAPIAEPPLPVASPRETAAAAEAVATAAVQGIVSRYQAALEARDIDALKRIWPTLAGRQEDAIRSEFQHARSIDVTVEGIGVKLSGANAVVTGRRDYRVTTVDGKTLRTATRMTITLARHDGAWTIETIRHETTQ